ncbi:MAG TPA: hypothetical protein VFI49_14555 [Rudaea sp.]|nr:hypothetical protein [Rudaea sp.]
MQDVSDVLGLGFRGVIRGADSQPCVRGEIVTALLQRMYRFVRQQAIAFWRREQMRFLAQVDVVAQGIGARANVFRCTCRFRTTVHAHAAEISREAGFQRLAQRQVERLRWFRRSSPQ